MILQFHHQYHFHIPHIPHQKHHHHLHLPQKVLRQAVRVAAVVLPHHLPKKEGGEGCKLMLNFSDMTYNNAELEDLRFKVDCLFYLFGLIVVFQIFQICHYLWHRFYPQNSHPEKNQDPLTFFGEKNVQCPSKSKALQAGHDTKFHWTTVLPPDTIKEIELEVGIQIPPGHFGWITLRSSAHTKKILVHAGAVIDEYFTGYLKVYLWNLSKTESYVLERGTAILQLLVIPHYCGLARLVHPRQLVWSHQHLALRTGSSGNTSSKDFKEDEEKKQQSKPAIKHDIAKSD
jgi:dUTPase